MTKFQLLISTLLVAGAIFAQQTPAVNTQDGRFQTLGSQQGKNAVDPYAAKGPSTAPASRTADGKPDLSGNWAPNAIRQNVDMIGSGVEVPMQAWAAALYKEHKDSLSKDDPEARC